MRVIAPIQERKAAGRQACHQLVRDSVPRVPEQPVELRHRTVVTDAEDAQHEPLRLAQAVALKVTAQLEKQLEMSTSEQIDEEILAEAAVRLGIGRRGWRGCRGDRKSTRLNSSHGYISYAV